MALRFPGRPDRLVAVKRWGRKQRPSGYRLVFPLFGSLWKEPLVPLWKEPLVLLWKEPLVPAFPPHWFLASLVAGLDSMSGDLTVPIEADVPA